MRKQRAAAAILILFSQISALSKAFLAEKKPIKSPKLIFKHQKTR